MKCISSPLLQDKSNKKGFPFLLKPNKANIQPGYMLKNPSENSMSSQQAPSNNVKRMWNPEGKENFTETSEHRKKVKLDINCLIDNENKQATSSTEQDSVWRIDHASLKSYSNASTTTQPSPDPNNPDDQIQIACSKILQELSRNTNFWKDAEDSDVQASEELYNNLKSQFWVKYNKHTVPKFVLSGIAIEGGTGLDESSFVKLITQPPSTSTGAQKGVHETPVGKLHQIDLTSFTLNINKRRKRRPAKLVWSPNALSEEDWNEYLAEISKIVGEKITKEDAVAHHLVKFHGNFDEAIEEVRKKKMYYRTAFRVCQKNLRSRSVVS